MNGASVTILSGENVKLNVSENKSYAWSDPVNKTIPLEFSEVYEITHIDWSRGIQDCVWQLHGRIFTDLSCLKGKTIKEFPVKRKDYYYSLKHYSDGKKFLFYSEEVPTFDSGDREWDSMKYRAVYCDEHGVNLIHCHEGYKLGRFNICVGLKKAGADFFIWLAYIGCPYNKLPEKLPVIEE